MKHLALLMLATLSLGGAVAVLAHNVTVTPVAKPGKIKILRPTPTPSNGKVPPQEPRIGERFRLRVWAVVLPAMPTRNWCGTLKINDQLRWNIPQSEASNHALSAGETLLVSEDTTHRQGGPFAYSTLYGSSRKVKLTFDLSSVDAGRASLRAAYRDHLDLLRESGKTYKCSAGKGEVALYVQVERTGYIYGPLIQRPFPTPTPRFRRPPHRS